MVEAYVEVKLFTRDDECDEIIIEGLREFLQNSRHDVIVSIELSEELSLPKTKRRERMAKRRLAMASLREFQAKYESLDFSALPARVDVIGGRFQVDTSPINHSLLGVMRTGVFLVPGSLKEKLQEDIILKAVKRNSWTGFHRSKPFFVAIYCDQPWIDEQDAEDLLLGERCTVAGTDPMPLIPIHRKIQEAAQGGWRGYLEAKYLIPRDRTYLDWMKRGIFFTRSETRNISGVIVGRESNSYTFVPNPFCALEINNPALSSFV